jgi:hypothetical protein
MKNMKELQKAFESSMSKFRKGQVAAAQFYAIAAIVVLAVYLVGILVMAMIGNIVMEQGKTMAQSSDINTSFDDIFSAYIVLGGIVTLVITLLFLGLAIQAVRGFGSQSTGGGAGF